MRPVPYLVGALALIAVPAMTQSPAPGPAPAPPPPSILMNAPQDGAMQFRSPDPRKQCFNGRFVVGSNRAGDRTLYVQAKTGGIFRLTLKDACDGLNAAQRLTVRADGNDVICPGQAATVVLKTAAGPKRCAVGEVRHLSRAEVAGLAPASKLQRPTRTELAEATTAERR